MGMDVFGKSGNYFRASIWTWPALMALIAQTEVLSQDVVNAMQFNDGAGPDARQAGQLADALERLIAGEPADRIYHCSGSNCPTFGLARALKRALQANENVEALHPNPTASPEEGSSVDIGCIREFIRFCRESGGFEVW